MSELKHAALCIEHVIGKICVKNPTANTGRGWSGWARGFCWRRGTCTGASVAAIVVNGGQCRFHNIFSYAAALLFPPPPFRPLFCHMACHFGPLSPHAPDSDLGSDLACCCYMLYLLYINLTSKHAPGKLAGNTGIFRTTPTAELMTRAIGTNWPAEKEPLAFSVHFLCIRSTPHSYQSVVFFGLKYWKMKFHILSSRLKDLGVQLLLVFPNCSGLFRFSVMSVYS